MKEYIMIKETGNAPITVAKLVRCKNCIHYIEFLSMEPEHKKFCDRLDWFSDENDFCSKGETNETGQ